MIQIKDLVTAGGLFLRFTIRRNHVHDSSLVTEVARRGGGGGRVDSIGRPACGALRPGAKVDALAPSLSFRNG